jgi:hypothetical protein
MSDRLDRQHESLESGTNRAPLLMDRIAVVVKVPAAAIGIVLGIAIRP